MARSLEGNKCHLLKSGFHVSKSREPSPQRDPDHSTHLYPSPLRCPHHAHLSSLSLTWTRSGSRKEGNFRAGRKAICASANHARQVASLPARPNHVRNRRHFGRGLQEPGSLEFKACQRAELCLPHPPLLCGEPDCPLGPSYQSSPRWVSLGRGCCVIFA